MKFSGFYGGIFQWAIDGNFSDGFSWPLSLFSVAALPGPITFHSTPFQNKMAHLEKNV